MIACQACGHSNPLGRVFCQKCGTKLDLSKVRPPGSDPGEGGASGVTVGVKKEDQKRGKTALKTAIRIFDMVLLVAVIAGIVLMWQQPAVKSSGTSSIEASAVKIQREKLDFAISNKRPYEVKLDDMQMNSYLASVSDMGKSSNTGLFQTDAISLSSQAGTVQVDYVRKIVIKDWEKKLVMRFAGRPESDGSDFRFVPVSGSIGKLPIPGFGLKIYSRNFARLFADLDSERELLAKLTGITAEPNKLTLRYDPKK